MARWTKPLPAAQQAEIDACIAEGLGLKDTWIRLARRGHKMPERTLSRLLKRLRAEKQERERRITELREIGRGVALAERDLGSALAVVGLAVPQWRDEYVEQTTKAYHEFLHRPTAESFSAVCTGMFALLIASQISGMERLKPVLLKREAAV